MATLDLSPLCDLGHGLWQCRILNPLSEARDQTPILTVSQRQHWVLKPTEPQQELWKAHFRYPRVSQDMMECDFGFKAPFTLEKDFPLPIYFGFPHLTWGSIDENYVSFIPKLTIQLVFSFLQLIFFSFHFSILAQTNDSFSYLLLLMYLKNWNQRVPWWASG